MKEIYLDHAATTPVAPEVLQAMLPYFSEKYGNASSIHTAGRVAKEALEASREIISDKINAEPTELIFTSGGTESNNLAIKGIAFANKNKGKHIIVSAIEHDCILNACKWLETQGYKITYLPVDKDGFVDPSVLEQNIKKDTILVSIMHANNEIGTIEPIEELGEVCHDKNVFFHTDACQSFTKVPIDVEKQNIDLLTINAHKIYGPKGVGALFIRSGVKLQPLSHGGGHERNLRSGTENIPGIVGFAKAVQIAKQAHVEHMKTLRDKLIRELLNVQYTTLNGHPTKRLCNNANFCFKYIEGESIVLRMEAKGIYISTGSACSSRSLEPSHTLLAIGLSPGDAHSSIRITVGWENTMEEIEYTINVLNEVIEDLRKISPVMPKNV